MKVWRASLVVVAIAASLYAPDAFAGQGGGAACQTNNPSGPPISISFVTKDFTIDTATGLLVLNDIKVLATAKGTTYGPFEITNVQLNVLNAMDAGCQIFNSTPLGSQILAATGLHGSTLNLTECSWLGPHQNADGTEACKGSVGTINLPVGWAGNTVTAYAGR